MLTRRFILAAAATSAAAATLKAVPAAPAPVAAEPVKAKLLAWTVGTPGDYNWEVVRAATEQEAIKEWICSNVEEVECGYPDDEDAPAPDPHRACVCDNCYMPEVWARRVPAFDQKETITPADWIREGIGHVCCRCGDESSPDWGAVAIGDEAVCEGCITAEEFETLARGEQSNDAEIPVPSLALPERRAAPMTRPSTADIRQAMIGRCDEVPAITEGRLMTMDEEGEPIAMAAAPEGAAVP